jgi:hypothetical protein
MTTGIEWYGAPRAALVRMPRIGGHSAGGSLTACAAVAGFAALAFLGNAYSNGGLIRLMGGVTVQQLSEEIASHPGPQGEPGPPGPSGPAGPPGDATTAPSVPVARLVAQAGGEYSKSGPIPHSEAYPVCALSKVVLRRDGNADGSCQLKHASQAGGQWEVVVNGASCSVTCFSLSTNR